MTTLRGSGDITLPGQPDNPSFILQEPGPSLAEPFRHPIGIHKTAIWLFRSKYDAFKFAWYGAEYTRHYY
ncbi:MULTISPECIES: hypothetical protein [Olivibacter]|uniref:Uncharacterized protein n=1 Tax=Olivibacter oleidegradans TaxID=760123 RepID=A0ABV6HDJ9_9SPHI|nr:hypothetical protein [Olivibacter sp. LS-1]MCL4639728.1 hypothetical protein [Olivibacter sp. UJ_SKK_5.1]QEK99487.1 hypothetical protein FKG96_01305 [Olivibacter sp. LS-1]